MFDLDYFSKLNEQRCEEKFHPIHDWSETDWACALAGEAGETCNLIKKRRRGQEIDTGEIGREIADTVCYADLLAKRVGTTLSRELGRKFDEISDRVGSDIKFHHIVQFPLTVTNMKDQSTFQVIDIDDLLGWFKQSQISFVDHVSRKTWSVRIRTGFNEFFSIHCPDQRLFYALRTIYDRVYS